MSRRTPYEVTDSVGPRLWRSLEEKDADPAALREEAAAEFPNGVVDADSLLGRRTFLTLSGAAAALTAQGCIRRSAENIMPFARAPEYVVPGVPLHFATVTERRGEALGLLVTSHEGRPTKIEGNPEHPSSRGRTDLVAQASILDLYDPDRSRGPSKREGGAMTRATWADAEEALTAAVRTHQGNGGEGLRILHEPSSSPTFVRLRQRLLQRFPRAQFHAYGAASLSNAREGARLAFGRVVDALPDYSAADVVLSLDSDFLGTEQGMVRATREFASRRRPDITGGNINRLYVVEGVLSVTGTNADHRLRLPSSQVGRYLLALAQELGRRGLDLGGVGRGVSTDGIPAHWVTEVAADLQASAGRSLVVAGSRQPAWVHALAHAINGALGNVGATVRYIDPVDADEPDNITSLRALVDDVKGGRVRTLVILGGNPAYDAPADVGFAEALGREGLTTFHLSSHVDETSSLATWHLPRAHYLETWGDLRSTDGTIGVQQPLIAPLFGGRSDIELVAWLAAVRNWRGYYVVRDTFRERIAGAGGQFERVWRRILHAGLVAGTELAPITDLTPNVAAIGEAAARGMQGLRPVGADNLEVVFTIDNKLVDGRHANNLWLLELPDPITKVSWDNVAALSPATARELGVTNGQMVRLSREGAGEIEIAAFVLPGQPDWSIALPLGWGRASAGKYGNGAGFDVYPLRTSDAPWFASGVSVRKSGGSYRLAVTQEQGRMEGRPMAIVGTAQNVEDELGGADKVPPAWRGIPSYADQADFPQYRAVELGVGPLWQQIEYDGYKWGMAIDLSACTGCNACAIACQAENNTANVGKREVARGREMYWLQVDRYFIGDDANDPLFAMQPRMCVHCEEAPCENVCPVNATAHSPEGLNEMAYNRCIGTRYCMNNCPYKVRKFNYLGWHERDVEAHPDIPETRKMQFNPNVTVRMRGVMEKCTYCVQRIQEAKIAAKRERRLVREGEIVTACAQACPADAIVFGDLNSSGMENGQKSRVAELAQLPRGYRLLAEIGTQPRTTYLGSIRNPNLAMLRAGAQAEVEG